MKRLSVIKEESTGLNEIIRDNYTHQIMTRQQLVKKIESGLYENYHVRTQKRTGIKYVASNPDGKKNNNLDD